MKKSTTTRGIPFHDVAIIGGGSAGYAAARITSTAGLDTVVIEGAQALGGLCILRGCMPSKALLYAAEVLHLARHGKTWGLKIPHASFNFRAVMARKRSMVEEFARYRRDELQHGKFKLIRAQASFIDKHTVELCHGAGKRRTHLKARYFIICTGSVSAPPPLSELAEVGFLTSDDALALTKLPKSLIVLGGGLVAVELAQFFRRFDVDVSIIQRGEHLLRDTDADAADTLQKVFEREGVRLFTETKLTGAFRSGKRKGVTFQKGRKTHRLIADEILLALGRLPATNGLNLEKIGVRTEYGRIVTNSQMQTSMPHIYAAGDCTSLHQIVHVGVEQGEVAARNILRPSNKQSMDYRLLCGVVFTDPQVATVGLTERQAAKRHIPYIAASHPFNDHGKAMIMGTKDGFVKLLADSRSGEILGGACVGPMGGELIHQIIAAMRGRMTVAELAAMPHYHPTLAEIWTYPASDLAEQIAKGKRKKRK